MSTTSPSDPSPSDRESRYEYGHDFLADLEDIELSATTFAANLTTVSEVYELPGLAALKDMAWAVAYALRGMVSLEIEDREEQQQGRKGDDA